MSKNYFSLARTIIKDVGGAKNIKSLHHCQTRLRFLLNNYDLTDTNDLKKQKDILQVVKSAGEFQIVIGMTVAEVYHELMFQLNRTKHDDKIEKKKAKKQKPIDIVTDFISSVFSPIIPALAGAGMVKALLAIFVAFKVLAPTSQTYTILNMIGDGTFAFLPILLAFTTAKKLQTNPYLAVSVAGIICHPTWATLVTTGKPIHLFNVIPVYSATYIGSVIPIILVILVQAPIERWLNKVIPHSIRLVFAPMILFLTMGVLALTLIAPLGYWIGSLLTGIFTWLGTNASWAPAFILGGTYSILVVFGLHHSLAPIGMIQLTQMGYDSLFGPGVLLANIGQGTAGIIVGLMTKNQKTREIGTSGGITGLMGVTEPILYGVNFPKKYPLIAGAIGGACGGLVAGLLGVRRFATGSSGLPAIVMYIGDNTMRYFYAILIGLVITILVTIISTFILFKKFDQDKDSNETKQESTLKESNLKNEQIFAPCDGKFVPLSKVHDTVFSKELMGKGLAIEPTSSNTIIAPFNGKVSALMNTKHAIGITSDKGCELLIHIGLDTVNLNGKYYESFVKLGDDIKKGQKLISADFKQIKKAGFETQIPVIVTNSKDYKKVEVISNDPINAGNLIIEVIN